MKQSIVDLMKQEGLNQAAIDAFSHAVGAQLSQREMMIAEESISPAGNVPDWEQIISQSPEAGADLLAQCVIIKLNGGLGTSMGLQQAKSLLPIKPDVNFLDVAVAQVKHLRAQSGANVRLLLMNSFSTAEDTMAHLQRYADEGFGDPCEVQMLQNKIPKLLVENLEPASYPQKPDLAWCPPGHGDIYPALLGSGWLDKLLAEGVKYAFISNSDNLGAQMDSRFLHWLAQSDAPFVMEVTRRTDADKKGGHLARRKADGQLLLREVAQCRAEDEAAFQDITRHQFFNTNTLWVRLDRLRELLDAQKGVVPLPVIRNQKTLDPRDPSTPLVYQLEVAMGAAIECFEGAQAVCVPRSRFFPVKTCSDLLLLRSDAVEIDAAGCMKLAPECGGVAPIVDLDSKLYKLVDSLDTLGVPSLKHVSRLTLRGAHQFSAGEPLSGEVSIGI